MIANAAVRDERLTFKARGILAYLLSQSEGWDTSIRRLAESGPDGRSAVETGVKELVEAGYLIIDEQAREADGGFGGNTWRVTDCLTTGVADYPVADNPVADNPDPDNRATKKNILKKNKEEERTTDVVLSTREASFDEFWAVYPRRAGKVEARKAWSTAIKRALPEVIIASALRYRDDPNREDRFTAHPSTWLNQGRWDDDPLPSRASKPVGRVDQNLAEYHRIYGEQHEQQRSLPTLDLGLSAGWSGGYGDVGRGVG